MGAGIFLFFSSSPFSPLFLFFLFFVEASATIKSWFHFARHAPPEIIRFCSTSCNSTETLYFRDVDGNARIFFIVACKRVRTLVSLFSFRCEWKRGLFGCNTTFCFTRAKVTLIPRTTVARRERCNNNVLNVITLLIIVQQSNLRRHGNRRERMFASR